MSNLPTPADSPVVEPLHHPAQAALQPPLGNQTNTALFGAGMGQKALLAKKMAKSNNPSTVSPTDNLMTPCTAKISQAKKKHFARGGLKAPSFGSVPSAPSKPLFEEETVSDKTESQSESVDDEEMKD